jgi:hypothetical protein
MIACVVRVPVMVLQNACQKSNKVLCPGSKELGISVIYMIHYFLLSNGFFFRTGSIPLGVNFYERKDHTLQNQLISLSVTILWVDMHNQS